MSDEKRHKAEGEGFTMDEKPDAGTHPVDFATFAFSLTTGAFIQMGIQPDLATGKKEKNLGMARQTIDILLMLRDKTKGNLTSDESQLLEKFISQAQVEFVKASK